MAANNPVFGGVFHAPGRYGAPGEARAAQIARADAEARALADANRPHNGTIWDGVSAFINGSSFGLIDLGGDKKSDRYRGGEVAGFIPFMPTGLVKDALKGGEKVVVREGEHVAVDGLRHSFVPRRWKPVIFEWARLGFTETSTPGRSVLEEVEDPLMSRPRKYPPELLDRGARLVFARTGAGAPARPLHYSVPESLCTFRFLLTRIIHPFSRPRRERDSAQRTRCSSAPAVGPQCLPRVPPSSNAASWLSDGLSESRRPEHGRR